MADDQDDASKTEDPTAKRLGDARERGNIPKSQEVRHFFVLIGFAIMSITFLGWLTGGIGRTIRSVFLDLHHAPQLAGALGSYTFDIISEVVIFIIPVFGLFVFLALAASYLQNGWVWAPKSISSGFKISKLNPFAPESLKRIFSVRQLLEFTKSILKFVIISAAIALALWPEYDSLPIFLALHPADMLVYIGDIVFRILAYVLIVYSVVVMADLAWERFSNTKKLKMTRQEVKQERKSQEGDPEIKRRLRQIRMDRHNQQLRSIIPEADVVVTNPTHFAVALKYDQRIMEAPVMLAKGQDLIAFRIREIAEENDIPIVENPPVARMLFDQLEIGQPIQVDHYDAVAKIITYVFGLKNKTLH